MLQPWKLSVWWSKLSSNTITIQVWAPLTTKRQSARSSNFCKRFRAATVMSHSRKRACFKARRQTWPRWSYFLRFSTTSTTYRASWTALAVTSADSMARYKWEASPLHWKYYSCQTQRRMRFLGSWAIKRLSASSSFWLSSQSHLRSWQRIERPSTSCQSKCSCARWLPRLRRLSSSRLSRCLWLESGQKTSVPKSKSRRVSRQVKSSKTLKRVIKA